MNTHFRPRPIDISVPLQIITDPDEIEEIEKELSHHSFTPIIGRKVCSITHYKWFYINGEKWTHEAAAKTIALLKFWTEILGFRIACFQPRRMTFFPFIYSKVCQGKRSNSKPNFPTKIPIFSFVTVSVLKRWLRIQVVFIVERIESYEIVCTLLLPF
jgi:hypothetical protein